MSGFLPVIDERHDTRMYDFLGKGGGKRRGHGRRGLMHHSCWSTVVLEASQSPEAVYAGGIFATGDEIPVSSRISARSIAVYLEQPGYQQKL